MNDYIYEIRTQEVSLVIVVLYCSENQVLHDNNMEIIPYIFLLFTIRGHIVTGNDIEIDMVMPVVKELLLQSDSFNVGLGNKYSSQTCKNKNLSECYQQIINVYESEFKTTVLPMITSEMTEMMKTYNILVLSLMDRLSTMTKIDDNYVSAIDFNDSKAYCAIGFLKFANIEIKDVLKDYIFFSLFEKQVKSNASIRKLIYTFFASRIDDLKPSFLKDTRDDITLKLLEQKNKINQFSDIFCNLEYYLDFKWLSADDWLWNDLHNSKLFQLPIINGQSPMTSNVNTIDANSVSL